MLRKKTVDKSPLELLNNLQSHVYLKDFYLVGGTALALSIGHRKSVDLDLFSNFRFDEGQLLENLSSDFDYHLFYSTSNTLKSSIHGIKVDILTHRYPLISQLVVEEGICMLIASIKTNKSSLRK